MVRKTALVTAMLGAFASHAYALGLGEIKLNSALHQPLDAEITLLSATPEEVDQLKVRLASPEAYAQAGVERIYLHTRLKFAVTTRPDGTAVIKVTSQEPVREPYLDFMVQASWASGQLVREYTMLIDPPALMPAEAPAPAATAPTTARQAVPAPAPSRPADSGRREAIFTGSEYGPVQRNDTLWNIAEKVRPDAGVSMQQTMLGLVRANPEAFQHGNVNSLKAGHVLRVPSREEFTSISQAEARTEVSRHHRLWREGRSDETAAAPAVGKVEREAPAAETAEPAVSADEAGPAATAGADAQLKLVTPDAADAAAAADGAGGEAGAGTEVEQVRTELALAVEELEAQRQQNQDLNERLADLEQQIAQLHRLVQLSDDELARMQGSLAGEEAVAADAGEESPVPAQEQMTDETAAAAAPDELVAGTEPVEPAPADAAPEAQAEPAPPALQEDIRQPAPAPAEEGLLSRFLTNPLWQAGAGAVALLLLILAWLGARKRRMATTEFKESILAEPGDKGGAGSASAATAVGAAAGGAEAAAAEPQEEAPAPAASGGPQSDSSLFTDFSVSDMGTLQNEAEADPIAEADVYLAYGRYQQAEELIRGALDNDPDNADYRLKLLEVFHAARNQSAFDTEAEALLARLENQEDPAWQRVVEMGRELNPGNSLYLAGGGAVEAPAPAEPELTDLGGMDTSDTGLDEAGTATAESEAGAEEDNSLDFDLGELESFAPGDRAETEGVEPAEEKVPGLADDDENMLEFDLSETDEAAAPVGEAEEEVEVGEGELQAGDEVSTKLDLARAYIEMGDPEGARSILEEVMEEGNQAQKSEAETLMKEVV
ncbi:TfP pilus assembly protein FimV [Thiohalobacter thiocyanaticus]|uniref:TfP pilus assembly protein FimV n=1 Tax=Thiohalobacter thiocyanaticus TaxID=585455 RepID=A0A1Z4VQN2_9GAMM|nr:FimV/HubP family polar landmark protein [Thiohalobacter thiocyanaticus]BAZ93946.1 TfP pilus assembly protein FimV [Thiohalobacter thiocyanaticus]